VRRKSAVDGDLLLGVEVEGGLDVGELSRQGVRSGFAERWRDVLRHTQAGAVRPEFRLWASDLRAFLASVQAFLDGEEEALDREDRLTRLEAQQEYLAVAAPYVIKALNEACAQLDGLVGHLSVDEHAAHRAYLKAQLGPFVARSPFGRRAVDKPLGHAGDFEMASIIDRSGPDGLGALAEGGSLFGRLLNLFFVQLGTARAHYNRLEYLGGLIRQRVAASDAAGADAGRRVRLASIGCGPATELTALLSASPELGARLEVALLDPEERALAHCERTLGPLAARTGLRCQYVPESVGRLIMARDLSGALGQRDLIYSTGLFDYLNERTFRALLERLYGALAPGGSLAIGNVTDVHPSRWALEYLTGWFHVGRTPAQLRALAAGLSPEASSIEVASEPSGVGLFLHVRR
jgi:extracellular factor (EF) 3-hydroxypalmitic acid methyl ester biosynthesis protein